MSFKERLGSLISKLGSSWKKMSHLGTDGLGDFQSKKVIWLNQIAFLSILCNVVMFPVYAYVKDYLALTSLISLSLIESVPLFLNYRKSYKTARVYASVLGPTILMGVTILFGQEPNFEFGFAIVVIMIFIFFESFRERLPLILFAIGCFLFSDYYVGTYGYLSPNPPRSFDHYVVFFSIVTVVALVIHAFIKENKNIIEGHEQLLKQYKEKNQDLERFTYIASHDLKTPLRTIVSFLGLMERDFQKGDTRNFQEHLNFVRSGAKQMYFLISDILEYSKVNNSEQKRSEVDLNTIITKVTHNLTDSIQTKNAIIKAQELPTIFCNETQLLIAFQNIIENGIKYNQSEFPTVEVSAQLKQQSVIISFEDNGIGIEPQYADHIFEMFKRLHTVQEYQGTGIGLAICKKIIEDFGGKIWIESKIGIGTTFFMELPLADKTSEIAQESVLVEA